MAEIMDALSASLYEALEHLERIQFSRSFDEDWNRHQITLDIIQLRLSRWGEAAGFCTSNTVVGALTITDLEAARDLIARISDLCAVMQMEVARLEPNNTSTAIDLASDLSSPVRTLRSRLRPSLVRRHTLLAARAQHHASKVQCKWAFYKKAQFDNFATDISENIGYLENLFPQEPWTAEFLQELGAAECAGISKVYLKVLVCITQDFDPWLDAAVKATLNLVHGSIARMMPQVSVDSGYGSSSGMVSDENQADDDTCSIHSILTNAPRIQLGMDEEENLVSAFAADLCQDMQINGRMGAELQLMLPRLHSLLKGFAVRLKEDARSMDERNAAEFVRQQREAIANQICMAYGNSDMPEDDGSKGPSNDGMTVVEKMALWPVSHVSEPPPPEAPPVEASPEEALPEEDKQDPILPPRYQQVRDFLRESSAYSWLLEKMRISALLTDKAGTPLQSITSTLDDLFRSMRERSLTGPIFSAHFEIDWDLPNFLRRQKYDTTLDIAVEQAITLTGAAAAQDVQAMTCVDYMSQTWPSSGLEIIRTLQQALKSNDLLCKKRLSDGTIFAISLQSPKATVSARGGRAALTELCEQFAWLGAALGAGPEDTSQPSKLWIATPTITASNPDELQAKQPSNSGKLHAKQPSIEVQIQFSIRWIPEDSLGEGTCWHAMFHHPVVVDGFPIVTRPNHEKGLEIPTNMMGALAESNYATHYAETMVLKGFCSMLVPTACTDGSITWHYLYNQDGSWLPYNSFYDRCPSVVQNLLDPDMLNRGNIRNFVGWASRIARNLGTDGMNYTDIRPAGASECSAGVGVEKKLTISVSKLFGASASFVRGDRDKSITSRKEPYHGKVNAARRLPVLFYDQATKRGWLVDGASALLHIARSQVVHPPYSESSHFNDTAVNSISFKHPKAEDSPDAASEMLKDHDNQRHIINSEFGGYEQGKTDVYGRPQSFQKYNFFKQLILDTWDTFDQIYSQQDQAKKSQTQQLRIPGSSIEGYEYMDLVSLRSSLTRRYINLHRNGSEWSSFIRKINAITLFGQNFGEIYTPGRNEERHICAPWRTVPTDLEYLTIPILLLKELNKHSSEDGKIGPGSLEIAKNVTWAPSEGVFRRCAAAGRHDCAHEFQDRVQRLTTFSIRKSRKGAARKDDIFATSDGAVIIGSSSSDDSIYNSSSAASFSDAAGRSSDAGGDGSSVTAQTSVPGVPSTEDGRTGSPIMSPPCSSEELPASACGSSDVAVSTVSQTNDRRPEHGSSAIGKAARKPIKLRNWLLVRKIRELKQKIRQGRTTVDAERSEAS